MRVELPFPPRELSPNARVHFHERAKVAKAHREQAYWLAHNALTPESPWADTMNLPGPITLTLTFHPPSKRRYDMDGLLSRAKAQIDGIADALGVNDFRFEYVLRRGDPIKGGKLIVEIS